MDYDVTIVGAGIVGLAVTYAVLEANPHLNVAVIEKEPAVGRHQTGHNSGVIHAGIYYAPGSLKARLCIEGSRRLIAFCQEKQIPYDLCGKVIVATDEQQLDRLSLLFRRGQENGVPGLRLLDQQQLRELEPHAAGLAAIYSPMTGIVDFAAVAQALAAEIEGAGVHLHLNSQLLAVNRSGRGLRLKTTSGTISSRFLINCAGLYADQVARMTGLEIDLQIIPFRGEYYWLKADRSHLVQGLIYPVPDPRFPFLGVHLTKTITGKVEAGPNAVLALAREGYRRSTIRFSELKQTLLFPGFWALARRYWRVGLYEWYRSLEKGEFARSLQQLVPELTEDDLCPGGAGVRAQAVTPDGQLIDDFYFVNDDHCLHVLNAPSPAATASLAIGQYIASKAAALFNINGH